MISDTQIIFATDKKYRILLFISQGIKTSAKPTQYITATF